MKRDLRKLAKQSTILCELMEGREKIETADIIKYYPNGITVINYSNNIPTEFGLGVVYIFKEEPTKFAFGGLVIKRMFDDLEAEYEGDVGELRNDLKEGLKIKLSTTKTKKGQQLTAVEIL